MQRRTTTAALIGVPIAIAAALAAVTAAGPTGAVDTSCGVAPATSSTVVMPDATPPESIGEVDAPSTSDADPVVGAPPPSSVAAEAGMPAGVDVAATTTADDAPTNTLADTVPTTAAAEPGADSVAVSATTTDTAVPEASGPPVSGLRRASGGAVAAEPAPPPRRQVIRVETLLILERKVGNEGFVRLKLLDGPQNDPCNVFPKMELHQLPGAQNRNRWYVEIKALADHTCELRSVTVRSKVDDTAGLSNQWDDAELRQGRKKHTGVRIYFTAPIDAANDNTTVIFDFTCKPGTPPFP